MAKAQIEVGESSIFFTNNARYLIAPEATSEQLGDDLNCLLEAALDAFNAQSERLHELPGAWAGLYALRQAHAVFTAYQAKVDSELSEVPHA